MISQEQIPFDITVKTSYARDDLVVTSANQNAADIVDQWPEWPVPYVALVGPIGAGKTHIARTWCEASGALVRSASEIDAALSESAAHKSILLEDVDRGTLDEVSFFHLLNAARQNGQSVLMTSRIWPAAWGIDLPDLSSRIRSATLVELQEPDDELLSGVLCKLGADRQISFDEPTLRYLVTHMERSLDSASQLVDALDKRALALKRPITRRLAAEILQGL